MAKLGDYVSAKMVGVGEVRQGVFTQDNGDGTITLEGIFGTYICEGPESVVVINDKDLFDARAMQHAQAMRQRLKISL